MDDPQYWERERSLAQKCIDQSHKKIAYWTERRRLALLALDRIDQWQRAREEATHT